MHKLNQSGAFNLLIIPLVFVSILVLVFGGLAIKFFTDYTDQRDNNQPKIEAAVEVAKADQKAELEAEFLEREKQPYKTLTGPTEYGSVQLTFPKTWSTYINSGGGTEYDLFSHPNFVPAANVNYALRMSVVRKPFANEVKSYDNQVKKGELKATSVQSSGVTGTRLDGFLEKDKEGSMVIFPLRDKTLRVWTESTEFLGDFNTVVLKSLTFVP